MDGRTESLVYHIECKSSDIGRYCILPGDPGRCEMIAGYLDEVRFVARNREFVTYTGKLGKKEVSVVSTGIGGPSAAIAMEELVMLGAKTFIRVGTCGGIDLGVHSGDIIIATGAVRQEGTSLQYAPPEYPAVASFEVTAALKEAAERLGCSPHMGIVQSKDSFYGQHNPERMPVSDDLLKKWEAWKRLGVLGSEMECAALYVTASALKVNCGAVLLAIWNQERVKAGFSDKDVHSTEQAVEICIEALRHL